MADRWGLKGDGIVYLDAPACPLWSPGLRRYTCAGREAAMRSFFGRVLAERRKTFFSKLLRLPRIREIDLIHAHFMGWAFEVAVPLGRLLNIPVTLTVHNGEMPKRRESELVYLQRNATRIVHVSRAYLRIWAERTGSSDRLTVVPNGIDLSEFQTGFVPREPRKGLKIISIARLVPEKRVADALVALARLRRQGLEFEYVAVGEGPERAALELLTRQLGLGDRVAFLGAVPREAVVRELCTSDILVHPSETESFGMAVAEAMAAQVAVVVARSAGPRDIVDHGVTGFLYEPGDIEALALYVQLLARDPALRRRFGELAYARVLERFSWDVHMSQMLDIWHDLLPAAPGAAAVPDIPLDTGRIQTS